MQERKQVSIILIATNKYKQFVQPLIESINQYFLLNHSIKIFLFTDEIIQCKTNIITQTIIPPYKFPYATLYRYKIITENKTLFSSTDYVYYLDVDMKIVDYVCEEIFTKYILAIKHPGYYLGGWGSPNYNIKTGAYLPNDLRKTYYAGGFQGGATKEYLKMAEILSQGISKDERNNVMAEWHDETWFNWYLNSGQTPFNSLSPEYCMVENEQLRRAWKIDKLKPKILALDKNHKELRA